MTTDYTQMPEKLATATTYTASAGAIFFGLSVNEFAAMAGIFIALCTFVLNGWFKWKHLQLTERGLTNGDE